MPKLQLLPLRVDLSGPLLRLTQRMDEKGEYDFDDVSGVHWENSTADHHAMKVMPSLRTASVNSRSRRDRSAGRVRAS
jgi:hypothetical protein